MSKEQAVATQATGSMHVRGSADAPVTLEEFGDFQCPPMWSTRRAPSGNREGIRDAFACHLPQLPNYPSTNTRTKRPTRPRQPVCRANFGRMICFYREQDNWSKTKHVRPAIFFLCRNAWLEPGEKQTHDVRARPRRFALSNLFIPGCINLVSRSGRCKLSHEQSVQCLFSAAMVWPAYLSP